MELKVALILFLMVILFFNFFLNLACAEQVTYKIKREIEFYDKFKPYEALKSGVFGCCKGIQGEYIIPIRINIQNHLGEYKDEFNWDLLNEYNR